VFFNGFYGPDSEILPGLADHSWITGSVAWMYECVIEHLLGLRRSYDGLRIQPRLPSEWREAKLTRIYRGTTYRVTILNPALAQAAPVRAITIDGAAHPPDQPLPIAGGGHEVVVTLAD
jgi:cellobiose phosphorylase